jgi:hypothetical protein
VERIKKRHRPHPDKTARLSSDTALSPRKYKNYSKNPDEKIQRRKEEKNTYSHTSQLEITEELQPNNKFETFQF